MITKNEWEKKQTSFCYLVKVVKKIFILVEKGRAVFSPLKIQSFVTTVVFKILLSLWLVVLYYIILLGISKSQTK